jgi:hypothetical protein
VGIKLDDRNTIVADESVVIKDSVTIGTGDYGYITGIYKRIGMNVNEGEALFSYQPVIESSPTNVENVSIQRLQGQDLNNTNGIITTLQNGNDLTPRNVASTVEGTIKRIYYQEGSYITRDDKIMDIQIDSSLIRSKIHIEPENLDVININTPVEITFPNGEKTDGLVSYIHPEYDFEKEELTIDSTTTSSLSNTFDGIPVTVKLKRNDPLYLKYTRFQHEIKSLANSVRERIGTIF